MRVRVIDETDSELGTCELSDYFASNGEMLPQERLTVLQELETRGYAIVDGFCGMYHDLVKE